MQIEAIPELVVPRGVPRGTVKMCARCGGPRDRGKAQSYCRECHAEWQRNNRPVHSALSAEAKKRANCRRYTGMLVKRGQLQKTPCACGSPRVTAVHLDWDDPAAVEWKCADCRAGRVAAAVAA